MEENNHTTLNVHSSHSHNQIETNDHNLTARPKKDSKIFVIAPISLYTIGTITSILILSQFYENPNDKALCKYLHIFLYINMIVADYLLLKTDSSQTNIENTLKSSQRFLEFDPPKFKNYCEFCKKSKFERSSHCSQCDVCIIRRDHHCVWLGKCIGYTNTQYFLNKLIWSLATGLTYISEFINFYNNSEALVKKNSDLKLSASTTFLIYVLFVFAVVCVFGFVLILVSQLLSIYSESSMYEKTKNHNLEYYMPLCAMRNFEEKDCLVYNKGFVHNCYNIIGWSLLHFFFPIPKFSKYDMDENRNTFSKAKFPYSFEVRKILPSDMSVLSENELRDMDPDNFLQLALKKHDAVNF